MKFKDLPKLTKVGSYETCNEFGFFIRYIERGLEQLIRSDCE